MTEIVQVRRVLAAPADEIFDAWTDPAQLQQWLCPGSGVVAEVSCDPVVGGGYRLVMVFDHGAVEVTGTYLVVQRPHRLVFTWRTERIAGRETRVSVSLRPAAQAADRTEMTITHERAPTDRIRDALAAGWADVAQKLHRHLGAGRTAERRG